MLELALRDFPGGELWDGEIRRGGISYTVDTVRELRAAGKLSSGIGLIIGEDLAPGFPFWRDVQALVSMVDIILARRSAGTAGTAGTAAPGRKSVPEELQEGLPTAVDFPFPCIRLENTLWPCSSTEIRMKIARKENLEDLIPGEVAEYIYRNGLYADATT